jgi:hypothetical protein
MRNLFSARVFDPHFHRTRFRRPKRNRYLGVERLEPREVPAAILNIQNAPTGIFPQFALVDPNPNAGSQFGALALFLSTGNIVVTDPFDDAGGDDAGAVYLFHGTTGALISTLTGSSAGDDVGNLSSLTLLTNGNFLVISPSWDNGTIVDAGAVTWVNGNTGLNGVVSAANSLVGTKDLDHVGGDSSGNNNVVSLSNGNYVVASSQWDNGLIENAGAVTWGNGTTGISGPVTSVNSLVGSTKDDRVGGTVTALTNGNYVVGSRSWDNGSAVNAGAATWGNGTTGISGIITVANSLVGSKTNDEVGRLATTALTNGNYVVATPFWDDGAVVNAGAVTWGNGTTGVSGIITSANSLVGSQNNDSVGNLGVTALINGNYVVQSEFWSNGTVSSAGAATWGNGTTGTIGAVSPANSLVGSQINDRVSINGVTALSNGNYVVRSEQWNNGTVTDAGAATWGKGTTGISGVVSPANSLVGSQINDKVGNRGVTPLVNGNYVVSSINWDNGLIVNAGAATWGNGTTGISGPVTAANSLVGTTNEDQVGIVTPLSNGNYVVGSSNWDNGTVVDAGAATWGNGTTGINGVVTPANSLVGSKNDDKMSRITSLTNGNYVVHSSTWDNGAIVDAGAATWGSGTTGISGVVTSANSLVGVAKEDRVGGVVQALANGNYIVQSFTRDNGTIVDAGAITWEHGATGKTLDGLGTITPQNSILGTAANAQQAFVSPDNDGRVFTVFAPLGPADGTGQVIVAFPDANLLTFDRGGPQTLNVTPELFTISLSTGQSVVSQATSSLNVNSTITVFNSSGNGGDLTLESKGALNLNASLSLDNGNLTLIGTTITPAAGAKITTGNGTLNLPSGTLVLNQSLPVNGGINLAGVSLDAQLALPATPGQSVTLIAKLNNGPIVGTFAGLSEGASLFLNGQAYSISYIGGNGNDVILTRLVLPPPVLIGFPQFGVGTDVGDGSVKLFNPNGTLNFTLTPFPAQPGGVRTAAGDFTGDGVADLVVGTGPGGPTHVKVINGATQAEIFSVDPFEAAFTGGVYLAVGDITGDGVADLAISPDEGGGPRVRAFKGNGFIQIADFFGIDDPNFRGGARAAIGDLNGDGNGDLVVVAGFGGGPRVAAFDGNQLQSNGGPKLFDDFFAFEQTLRNGIFVAAGDVNGDGFADLVAAGGPGGGPRVFILDGLSLVQNGSDTLVPVGNFFAGDPANRGGVRVAVKNLDNDDKADVVTGAGTGAGSRVTAYRGTTITPTGGTPPAFLDFDAFPGFGGGVFVG